MYTVMVTGGLGSGKSTLVGLLCERGAVSIDLDQVGKSVLQDDEAYIAELVERFGEGILDEEGAVVPARLAERAFADEESAHDLDRIALPYIEERADEYILDVHCTPRSDSKVLVVEVAILTEAPELAELADEVIAVSAPSDLRLRRAIARGMGAKDALSRIRVQATDAERAALADTVCENDGSLEELSAWADSWWAATMEKLAAER